MRQSALLRIHLFCLQPNLSSVLLYQSILLQEVQYYLSEIHSVSLSTHSTLLLMTLRPHQVDLRDYFLRLHSAKVTEHILPHLFLIAEKLISPHQIFSLFSLASPYQLKLLDFPKVLAFSFVSYHYLQGYCNRDMVDWQKRRGAIFNQ